MHPGKAILIIGLALLIGRVSQALSVYLPTGKNVLSPYAWTIILVSTIAIILVHHADKPHPAHRRQQIRQMDLIFCADVHRCPCQFE